MNSRILLFIITVATAFCAMCCFSAKVFAQTSKSSLKQKTPPVQRLTRKQKRLKRLKKVKKSVEAADKKSTPKSKKKKSKGPNPNRTEFSALPVLNYTSDRGFGFGAYSVIARFKEKFDPYLWRIYFRFSATVKSDENGETIFPYHEDFVRLDLPGLVGGKLRVNARAGFFRFLTTGYYGFGNASELDKSLPKKHYQFDRVYPEAMLIMRYRLRNFGKAKLNVFFSGSFLYNLTNIFQNSKLAGDLKKSKRGESEEGLFLAKMLRGLRPHGQMALHFGIAYDSRDSEFAPSRGMFHEISVRGGSAFASPLTYAGINTKARFFFSIWKEYLVFAARIIADVLLGNPPFYEQYRFGGLFPDEGPGGGLSVRGTLPQRYYGKIKLIGNVELRSKLITIRLLNQVFNLGLVLFADTGRVWADYAYSSKKLQELIDGTGHGMKLGFGIGGRLQWGATVVMRVDAAYSPTDQNTGFFFLLGHLF